MPKLVTVEIVLKAVSALIAAVMSVIKFIGYIDKMKELEPA